LNPNKPIAEIRDTLINTFRHLPFYFSPGTFWRYSNSNYILLGYIIEKVSGHSYRDYLYNNLFLKAGMKNTDILKHDSIVASMADGYIKDSGEYKKGMIIPVNTAFSAGGIFSTLTDLYHWNVALNSGKIISKKSLEKMNKPNHEDRGAGYGVFIDMIFDHPAIFHSGNHPGFSSFMIYYPEDDINIVVLANRETNLDFFPRGIAGILFDKEVVSPYKHNRISLPAGSLQKYTGKFEGYYPFEVIEKDNKLFLRIYRDIELIPESVTKFFVDEQDVDIQVEYILDKNKQVTGLNFIEGGIKTRTTKK
ncbi:MAG: serine hydrolase domain-containing protein, partial [Flavitalea sp.]